MAWPKMLVALAMLAGSLSGAAAETQELRLAYQPSMGFLPMFVMQHENLVEKHLAGAGLGDTRVAWSVFSGGPAMNEALLSGNLDLVGGGIGPLLTIWAKTKSNVKIRGLGGVYSGALYLLTRDPSVRTIRDFGDNDRIAMPAAKVSTQAIFLEMAAAQAFGAADYDRLDPLTVSMPHPAAYQAFMSGGTEIDSHFSAPPFQYMSLRDPSVRKILSSHDILGGTTLINIIYATTEFHDRNPKSYAAVLAALKDALDLVNADKRRAAAIYVEMQKGQLSVDDVEAMLKEPDMVYTLTPTNVGAFADFMFRTGRIKEKPSRWQDVFFPEIHDLPGT